MQVVVKGLLVVACLVAVPAAATIVDTARSFPARIKQSLDANTTYVYRQSAAATSNLWAEDAPPSVELAQAGGLPPHMKDGFGPLFPSPGPNGIGAPGPAPFPRPPFLNPRAACNDDIDRHAALSGYLKSKLRLQGSQQDAWQKIEVAAGPAVETLRALCDELPQSPAARPSMPDAIAFGEKHLAAKAAFLRAIRDPMRALYETLSPDQRAALEPPAPPR